MCETLIGEWALYQSTLVKYSATYFLSEERVNPGVYKREFGNLNWTDLTNPKTNRWWENVPKVIFQTHGFCLNHLGITNNSCSSNHTHDIVLRRFRQMQSDRFQEYGIDAPSQKLLSAIFPSLVEEAQWAAKTFIFHQLWDDAMSLAHATCDNARLFTGGLALPQREAKTRLEWESETWKNFVPLPIVFRQRVLDTVRQQLSQGFGKQQQQGIHSSAESSSMSESERKHDGDGDSVVREASAPSRLWSTRTRPTVESALSEIMSSSSLPPKPPSVSNISPLLEWIKDDFLGQRMLNWTEIVYEVLDRLKYHGKIFDESTRIALDDWLQFVNASSQAIPTSRLEKYKRRAVYDETNNPDILLTKRQELWIKYLAELQDQEAVNLYKQMLIKSDAKTTGTWVPYGIADHPKSMSVREFEVCLNKSMENISKQLNQSIQDEMDYVHREWQTKASLKEVRFFEDAQGMFAQHLVKWRDVCHSGIACSHTIAAAPRSVPPLKTPESDVKNGRTKVRVITGEECIYVKSVAQVTNVYITPKTFIEEKEKERSEVHSMDTGTDTDTDQDHGTDTDTDYDTDMDTRSSSSRQRRSKNIIPLLSQCFATHEYGLRTKCEYKIFLNQTIREFLGKHAESNSLQTVRLPENMVAIQSLQRFAKQFICQVRQVILRLKQDNWKLPDFMDKTIRAVTTWTTHNLGLESILLYIANVSLMIGWFIIE